MSKEKGGTSHFIFEEVINSGFNINELFDNPRFTLESVEILQLMPAQGVVAIFGDGEKQVIHCWALRRETWKVDGEQRIFSRVVGMIAIEKSVGLEFVDGPNCRGFAGYGADK